MADQGISKPPVSLLLDEMLWKSDALKQRS